MKQHASDVQKECNLTTEHVLKLFMGVQLKGVFTVQVHKTVLFVRRATKRKEYFHKEDKLVVPVKE